MLFPTIDFAIFFVVVLLLNWLTMPHPLAWRIVMLGASYLFYGWWNWRFVGLLVASQVANHAFALAIASARQPRRRTWMLAGAVTANLAVLGTFKYYGFFVSSIVNGLDDLGFEVSLPLLQFVLPVGISFFTFQAISYVIDVYRGDTEPSSFLDFALYLAFFPQLVAGPIVRHDELVPQFRSPRDPRHVDSARGFWLIGVGLFKKVVIADFLARTIVDPVYATPGQHSAVDVLGAIYAFSVQIYCDFSGYTDIAIGVALLLGFVLPENFDAPYSATSGRDFWRRWHITLSRWLRDYLYIPLGGNRTGRRPTVARNLMITMLLGGLWHGAAWTFIAWGGLHGAWLVLERMRPRHRAGRTLWARRLATFHVVTALWILFRAESPSNALDVVSRLATGWSDPVMVLSPAVVLAIALGIGIQYVPRKTIDAMQASFSRFGVLAQGAIVALVLLVVDALSAEGVSAFIYFQF